MDVPQYKKNNTFLVKLAKRCLMTKSLLFFGHVGTITKWIIIQTLVSDEQCEFGIPTITKQA